MNLILSIVFLLMLLGLWYVVGICCFKLHLKNAHVMNTITDTSAVLFASVYTVIIVDAILTHWNK